MPQTTKVTLSMSIVLECYSLIIRRDKLEPLFSDGWEGFLYDYGEPEMGSFDNDLVRFGAMSPMDINMIVDRWEDRGLKLVRRKKGAVVAADMVLHASPNDHPVVPCSWLAIDSGVATFVGRRIRARASRQAHEAYNL